MGGGGGIGGAISAVTNTVQNAVSNPVAAITNPVGTVAGGLFGDKAGRMAGMIANPASPFLSQVLSGQQYAGASNIKAGPGGVGGGAGGMDMSGPGYDSAGRPLNPVWDSRLGTDGTISNQYKINVGSQPQMNMDALNAIRSRAMSMGPSSWGQAMNNKLDAEIGQQRDSINANAARANAQSFNDMAMRGGISAAARERMATSNAKNAMMQNQDLNRKSQIDRSNIAIEDENQKLGLLKGLPGQELQALEPSFRYMDMQNKANEYNSRASLDEIAKRRNFDLDQYKSAMSAWGANKAADAQIAALNQQGQSRGLLGDLFQF